MSAVDIIDGRGYILNVEFGGGKDGVDGKDGRDGVAPDLQIGTVKESEDDQPHVTISDEGDGKLSLNFDLVSGQDGQNGEDGGVFIPSVSQEGVISWIAPEGQNPPQAVSVKGETGATFTPTVSIGGEISWTNDKGLENPDEQNIRGPKGEKGDPFTIYKVYNSIAEMDADYSNPDVPMGVFVCITNSVDQSENARLYVKGTQRYEFITDLSGATGIQGVPGVSIGRIGLMEEQHSPLYKEYGVWSDQTPEVLLGTFNLPVGEDGQQGQQGVGVASIIQVEASQQDGGINKIVATLTDGRSSSFFIKNGTKGSTGAAGQNGQNGQDGQDGVGIDHISVEQSTFDGEPNRVTIHLTDESSETFNVYNGHTGATGTAGTLNTNNTSAATPTSESMSGNISLHKISKTGNYNDLIDRPTKLSNFTNDAGYQTYANVQTAIAGKQDKLTAGNNITISSNNTISTTAEPNVQSDWNQSNTSADDYIKNKPVLSTVATSGSYNDLTNKPAKSVYSDASDLANINNWPSIHTIEMSRKLMYTGSGDGVAPTAVLQYGSPITTGKQKWNGDSGDYIKYVPLDSNKEYVLEVTITSFSLEPTGVAREEYDISGVFFVKVRTGDDGYLSAEPKLMSYKLRDGKVYTNGPINAKKNQAFTIPYVVYYLNKKVGTITYGSTTADVTIDYGSGNKAYIDEVSGETYCGGMQLEVYVTSYGVTNKYTTNVDVPQGQHPIIVGNDNRAYINENATATFNINGSTFPVTFTDRGPVGDYSIALTNEQYITIPGGLYIANINDDHSYICACDYDYGTNKGMNIEASETSKIIDNLETSFDESANKIWVLSAPEVSGSSQRRLVIAITRTADSGGGLDVSAAIRVLKTTGVNRTYNYNDYDHIALPE